MMSKTHEDTDLSGTVYRRAKLTGAGFEDVCLGKAKFDDVNLGGASFHNVNLGAASFDDINLADATLRNVNLAGVRIDDANVQGMTIFGIDISELLQKEFDRRDPIRAELRMQDRYNPTEVRRVMARLKTLQDEFCEALRGATPEQLKQRAEGARWSPLHHLRHILFAEQLYINRWILANSEPFSKAGLLPAFLKKRPEFEHVGAERKSDLETVLSQWEQICQVGHDFAAKVDEAALKRDTSEVDFGQGDVGGVLQCWAHHDLDHIRKAQDALQ